MKDYTKRTIEFYDRNIETYARDGAVVLKNKIDLFIKSLFGKKILDVACGSGHDTDYFSKKEFDCLGIDLSKKRARFAENNSQGKFKVMDLFNMKFKNDYFDGIWCSSAIIHVEKKDIKRLLNNFSKILKKNGILGLINPAKQKRTKKKGDTRIFTMLTIGEFKKYLEEAGFKILFSETFACRNMKWIFIISKKR